jgi:FkbM family methyltransferase
MMRAEALDRTLVAIGRVIGKPPGWERTVRTLAPPHRYAGGPLHPITVPERYVFPVDRGTLIGWAIHFFGCYEPEVRAEIKRHLSGGGVAIDVGANVGWHALLMAVTAGPSGRVYAFEPNDSTRGRLLDALAANDFTHVVVDARAVADRSGRMGFQAPPAGHVWDGTGRLVAEPGQGDRQVESVTLDEFVDREGIDRVDLVKIDVEGWECSVLRGAAQLLATRRPSIIFEYDPAYVSRPGGTAAELTAWLLNAGYGLFALWPNRPAAPAPGLADRSGNFLAVPRERI